MIIPGRLTGRNTLTRKGFRTGASLKILSARAPRRLRRHDFKSLFGDEIDAMEITVEGDPIVIAEKRTFAHADRKIVRGSTPTEEGISLIERAYSESDQRIFQICCPHCAEWFELLWEMIQWPEGAPVSFGLHYGPVVLGDIGLTCLEFAVIGSTVNAASRLEALTRALDCTLVASDDLVKRAKAELGSADALFRPLMAQAAQTIRGLEHPIAIWTQSGGVEL